MFTTFQFIRAKIVNRMNSIKIAHCFYCTAWSAVQVKKFLAKVLDLESSLIDVINDKKASPEESRLV